jgi:hypothetical protein
MKCSECQILIEEYVDGRPDKIDQKAGALVSSHIATCSQCATFREGLIREQAIYARYERDVEVTPMLWSSIEARIKQERAAQPTVQAAGLVSRLREQMLGTFGAPRLSPALAFALVLVAITITVIVMTRLNPGVREVAKHNSNTPADGAAGGDSNTNRNSAPPATGGGGRSAEIAATPPVPAQNPVKVNTVRKAPATTALTPAQLVREAEQKYVTAIAMLSRDVNRKRSQLDPIMLARFDSALTDIDRTIKDTRRVVRDNPEDPIALQYLLAAYSKKVDVLRGMSAATTD